MPRVIHFDLSAENPERAIYFYSSVFGWKFEKWEGPMEYWMITTGSPDEPGIDGGLSIRTNESTTTQLTIGIENADAMSARVLKHGGAVIREKSAIPGIGWIVIFSDTEGNELGMIQEDPQAFPQ